jgi:ketosteroid isomerase-like protein
MAEGFRDWVNAWHGYYTRVEEYHELGDERVLVLNHSGGRGRASGLDLGGMQAKGATLFHLRHGEVTRLVAYWDRERALADLASRSRCRRRRRGDGRAGDRCLQPARC